MLPRPLNAQAGPSSTPWKPFSTQTYAEETQKLKTQIDDFLERNPEAGRSGGYIESLYRGIASHHAGVLPAWKGLVEELFQQGLIKIVFATETLAAGINMPARTTVISSLSKRTDQGHRLLTASEFLQMAGRAGRRGMDELGHVVTVQTPFEGVSEAVYLATSKADPLVSQFTPSYGMVLNLLQTHDIEQAQKLIERSFGNYLSTLYLRPQQQAIDELAAAIAQQHQQSEIDPNLVAGYEKLNERLKEERRLLKILHQQAYELEAHHLATALSFAVAGTILSLKGKNVPVAEPLGATLVLKTQGSGQFPYLICLGKDNRWYVVTVSDVVGLHAEYPRLAQADRLAPPSELTTKPGSVRKGDALSEQVSRMIPEITPEISAPEVRDQQGRVTAVEAQLKAHPLHQVGDPAYLLKRQRRIERMQEELASRQKKLEQHTQRYWQEFLDLMEVLKAFDCLENAKPKPLGQVAAAIRGDNELWLGLALSSGKLDALDPQQLAAACAALVTEVSRPDNWTRYSPSNEIEEALGSLRSTRRELFKLQRRYNIAMPIWLETDWIGLVEQWALGVEWPELCENTSLDEGDVVRILRRTVDFLSQVPHVPYLPGVLRDNAARAIQLIDRFPVNEGVD